MVSNRINDSAGDERHIRKAGAQPGVLLLVLAPDLLDVRKIDVKYGMHMRRRSPAEHHALGDDFSHGRERLNLDAIRRHRSGSRVLAGCRPCFRPLARSTNLRLAALIPDPWSLVPKRAL